MQWIKNHVAELLCLGAIVIILTIVGVYAWFRWAHTCTEWEDGPLTGRYCTAYVLVPTGKHSNTQQCISWKACRSCVRWVEYDNPDIPVGLERPGDRCP